MLNVYTCTDHAGHWPVGVASVVVAETEEMARDLLIAELKTRGLEKQKFTLNRIDITHPRAYVLNDGNY